MSYPINAHLEAVEQILMDAVAGKSGIDFEDALYDLREAMEYVVVPHNATQVEMDEKRKKRQRDPDTSKPRRQVP